MKIAKCLCAAALVLTASCSHTPGGKPRDSAGEGISPKADGILKEAGAFLSRQGAFTVNGERTEELVRLDGQKILFTATVAATVRRPGGLRTEVSVPGRRRICTFKAGEAAVWDTAARTATRFKAPDTIDGLVDYLAYEHGIELAMVDLIVADPYGSALENVVRGDYIGTAEVNGVLCHHLAFRGLALDWQIWIDTGAQPVPRKLSVTYRDEEGTPSTTLADLRWNFTPAIPGDAFDAAVPPAFREITPGEFREQWLYGAAENL